MLRRLRKKNIFAPLIGSLLALLVVTPGLAYWQDFGYVYATVGWYSPVQSRIWGEMLYGTDPFYNVTHQRIYADFDEMHWGSRAQIWDGRTVYQVNHAFQYNSQCRSGSTFYNGWWWTNVPGSGLYLTKYTNSCSEGPSSTHNEVRLGGGSLADIYVAGNGYYGSMVQYYRHMWLNCDEMNFDYYELFPAQEWVRKFYMSDNRIWAPSAGLPCY